MAELAQADVIIIGVGAMGSAAADRLAMAGKKVIGIEQFSIAHDQGSSHGGSRIIRQSYFEHPDYVPLLKRAYELYDDLDAYHRHGGGDGLFFRTGGIYFGPEDSVTLRVRRRPPSCTTCLMKFSTPRKSQRASRI